MAESSRRLLRPTIALVAGLIAVRLFGDPTQPLAAPRAIGWSFHAGDAPRDRLGEVAWAPLADGGSFESRGRRAWFRAAIEIPDTVEGEAVAGRDVGCEIRFADGGEIFVDGELQARYDNDLSGFALAPRAVPGTVHVMEVRAWAGPGDANLKGTFHAPRLEILPPNAAWRNVTFTVDPSATLGELPRLVAGLSQGGGLPDYDGATARALREAGFRYLRMDNILTPVLRRTEEGAVVHDWTDFDRRLGFVKEMGGTGIFCLSYMPIPLDLVPDDNRHSFPNDLAAWSNLVHAAVSRAVDSGHAGAYWEVWNEANSGWLTVPEGTDPLEAYLELYETSVRAVRAADPTARVGGPANASGPWNRSEERGYCVRGEETMAGLIRRCTERDLPLDFLSWHEYFHPPGVFRDEIRRTRELHRQIAGADRPAPELILTEWNYAWWHDHAQDNEVAAAWAVNTVLRAFVPEGLDIACFFLAKDGGTDFHGNWGMLLGDNTPKATYNACALLNRLGPVRIDVEGNDPDVSAIGSVDPATGGVRVLVCHFAQARGVPVRARLALPSGGPGKAIGGGIRLFRVDKAHANVFHDRARARLDAEEPAIVAAGRDSARRIEFDVFPNSVILVEIDPSGARR